VISAPAGTKRLGPCIGSLNWSAALIDKDLLDEADKQVRELAQQGTRVLCIHESSVLEKQESEQGEGVGPLISRKAKRLPDPKKERSLTTHEQDPCWSEEGLAKRPESRVGKGFPTWR